MNFFKKLLFVFLVPVLFSFAQSAYAMIPTVSMSTDPNNNSTVSLNINGDVNGNVLLYYYSSNASGPQMHYIGNTNASGVLSTSIALSDYNITQNSSISVSVNGQQSSPVVWPYSSTVTSGTISLSQSSLAVKVGQSNIVTASNNGTNTIYLSGNTSPQTANFSISGNQITVNGLTAGQTTATICLITTNSSTQNCASLYVVVQSATTQSLSFSQNNTSIISGQNIQITISGGNGFYQVQNNSNSNIISTSLNGPTLTLFANGTTGSSTVAICSTDMSSCGTVVASIGTYNTSGTGLSISTGYPTIITGQTQSVNISGGYGNYYISSNSNTSVVQTYLATSTLTLYGNTPGIATIIVCAPSGSCGTVVATVAASYGGSLTLSQSSVSVITGQVLSVNITGGTAPYSIIQKNDGIAQYSLSGSAITITGVSSGVSSATICSAGGACVTLTVTVTGTATTISGVQPVFSQNNFSMNLNQTTAIYLSGNGGYYISSNPNNNIVSATISGNSVVVNGIAAGSANLTVCQTGGQCNVLYINVSNTSVSTVSSVPITFSKNSIAMNVAGVSSVDIYGGSGTGYYVSYNSNSNVIGTYITGSSLIITGKGIGDGTLSVCSSASICGSISVNISGVISTTVNNTEVKTTKKHIFSTYLYIGYKGVTEVKKLQERLRVEGVYKGPISGTYGELTKTAVKKYQKIHKLPQLGVVGTATRAFLNK